MINNNIKIPKNILVKLADIMYTNDRLKAPVRQLPKNKSEQRATNPHHT